MKKQFCYILARQGINFELNDDMVEDDRELSQNIINNVKLSEGYLTLARDFEVMEPKCLENIYKLDKIWLLHLTMLLLMRVLERMSTLGLLKLALALLSEYINKKDSLIQIGAIMGLGIAYAGAQDKQVSQAIADTLTGRTMSELRHPKSQLLVIALGLIYLGKQKGVEATSEVSKLFSEKMKNYVDITLLSCAHAETGNILTKLLGHCSHLENAEASQGFAVLGIAIVAVGARGNSKMVSACLHSKCRALLNKLLKKKKEILQWRTEKKEIKLNENELNFH
ncbi:hypothetical protein GOBAR_AA12320 [Gossypium barbadense]|uniref:RPN1 N-terminal domain-containing protein n=1 Tax=Gossypium barbadense TaxID=3634 RepID=A0A2P5XYF0_GOSBA|nr:hypothetical protein GOBAR_AA12320 [Gossypium barbadense]